MKRRHSPDRSSKPEMKKTISNAMKVVVRVRPPNVKEQVGNIKKIIDIVDDTMLIFDPKEQDLFFYQKNDTCRDLNKRQHKHLKFIFDAVFGFDSTNEEVFEHSTKDIIPSLLEGYNCSVFAYGATGAGKTFTMLGTRERPGIICLTMHHLWREIEKLEQEREFGLAVSYLEVYNEIVRDLLSPSKPLNIREDPRFGIVVADLKSQVITNVDELLSMLAEGNKNRTQHPTDANAESSRSHAVFQLLIRSKSRITGDFKVVKLCMIDLAGSERGSATGYKGDRFAEGSSINRSLLALGNCINKLADGMKHIPYRDSKLTRILKDALGGNCRTIMLANIAPCSNSFDDTYNTLKYAKRAKSIKSQLSKNVVPSQLTPSQYAKVIHGLNEEIRRLKVELEKRPEPRMDVVPANSQAVVRDDCVSLMLKEEVQSFYRKKSIQTAEILTLESKLKILHWRYHQKCLAFERLNILNQDSVGLHNGPDRMKLSVNQFMRQARNISDNLRKSWMKMKNIHQEEQAVIAKVEQYSDDLSKKDLTIEKLEVDKKDLIVENDYLKQLMFMQHAEITSDNTVMIALCEILKNYHFLLKTNDMVTTEMDSSYQKHVKMLEGVKKISFDSDDIIENHENVGFRAKELLLSRAALHSPQLCTTELELPNYERWWSPKQLQLQERFPPAASVSSIPSLMNRAEECAAINRTVVSNTLPSLNETFCTETFPKNLNSTFLVEDNAMCKSQLQPSTAKKSKFAVSQPVLSKLPGAPKSVGQKNINKENIEIPINTRPSLLRKPSPIMITSRNVLGDLNNQNQALHHINEDQSEKRQFDSRFKIPNSKVSNSVSKFHPYKKVTEQKTTPRLPKSNSNNIIWQKNRINLQMKPKTLIK